MKELVFLGLFGMLTTVFAVIAVLVFGSQELASKPAPATDVVIWSGIPTALSTFCLSYAGNVVFPHVEDSMQKPKQWSMVLICSIATITLQYAVMAIFGYVAFGPEVQNPIFNSLPNTPLKIASQVAINVHIVMAAPILLCSFGNEVEQNLKITLEHMSKFKELGYRLLTRFITIVLITVLSAFLPYFASFMNLIGSISSSLSLFIFPVIFHLKIFGWRGRKIWVYIWMAIILIVGAVSFVLGTIYSIKSFIKAINDDK
jgi:vesicular inhibitory amino acid transporter